MISSSALVPKSIDLQGEMDMPQPVERIKYPNIRRDESLVKNLNGSEEKDPYRWMEDPNTKDLAEFIFHENETFSKYIENCPDGEDVRRRLTDLSEHEKYSNACKKGEIYYFFMNSAKQHHHEQDCLYVQDSLKAQPRLFLDPNNIAGLENVKPGQKQITIFSFSKNGELLAYGLSVNNSEWLTIRFKSAATGEDFPDVLNRVKESDITWLPNGKGILYSCYPQGPDDKETVPGKDQNQSLFYHALGTDQSQDILMADFSAYPIWMVQAEVSDCGEFIITTAQQDLGKTILFYSDLTNAMNSNFETSISLLPLLTKFDAYFEYITNIGSTLYIRTNKGAKNYRIMTMNLEQADKDSSWQTLIGEHPRNALDWVDCVNQEYLLVCYIRDVKHSLQLRQLDDGVLIYTFPIGLGTITDHFAEKSCSEFFFTFTSFLVPDKIYRVDLSCLHPQQKCDSCVRRVFGSCLPKPMRLRVFKEVELFDFKASEFVAKQVFYPSVDGTLIPLFLVHRKTLKLNGKAPCILYGYGGFGAFVVPSFSISRIPFIQNFNGVFALASIRGGGEYGQDWYDAGRLWGKQYSVDDLASAAEYLINNKYTTSDNLVVEGRRNGGLVAAACVNQRPDLFGGAIINEGILDLLRFQQFNAGKSWVSDYGDPDDPTSFARLCSMSPLHNVGMNFDKNCQYPALLVLTAKTNNEVPPLHSYKYLATLQQEIGSNVQQKNPLMLRVDTKYDEDDVQNPNSVSQLIDMRVDIYSFLIRSLGFSIRNLS